MIATITFFIGFAIGGVVGFFYLHSVMFYLIRRHNFGVAQDDHPPSHPLHDDMRLARLRDVVAADNRPTLTTQPAPEVSK